MFFHTHTRYTFTNIGYFWLDQRILNVFLSVMKYIEWNIDPVAFRVGGIPVMYYSLLLIAGTVLSVWIL